MTIPLSILDLAPIAPGQTARESFEASVAIAQAAEKNGYRRVWYAEHHNMPTIASSATSVLIGYVAAHTSTIRLGAGGIMLPNHAPLTIAEQFGTLATLYPDRIDLGLGRAPGSDQNTMRAMRRDPRSSDQFPQDVLELQGYLRGESVIPGVQAVPGAGTDVPLYILGSSLFGAQLAAALGLPYAFASHFAPDALHEAVSIYRSDFQPSRAARRAVRHRRGQRDRRGRRGGCDAPVRDDPAGQGAQHDRPRPGRSPDRGRPGLLGRADRPVPDDAAGPGHRQHDAVFGGGHGIRGRAASSRTSPHPPRRTS